MNKAADWIRFAREDVSVGELAFTARIYNQACFHAQQAVQKTLKAWLHYLGTWPPRTHQLSVLLTLLPADVLSDVRSAILVLDRFYIPTRYPDALPGAIPEGLPTAADAEEALSVAREVLHRTEDQLASDPSAPD